MPVDWSKYPENWKDIAHQVKEDADWKCQRCGKPCRKPHEDFDTHKRTLTVAHLDHEPMNIKCKNLEAMCAPCHLKYDKRHHAKNAAKTRREKQDKNQLMLFEGV
jgi:uncharacterized cysteine cluster protein YcgN (CxxCxxCC family)